MVRELACYLQNIAEMNVEIWCSLDTYFVKLYVNDYTGVTIDLSKI